MPSDDGLQGGFLHQIDAHSQQIAAAIEASPVSATISTYGVERNNLTIRQHSRRVGRRVNAFSPKVLWTW